VTIEDAAMTHFFNMMTEYFMKMAKLKGMD
jgi:hypothetical protein